MSARCHHGWRWHSCETCHPSDELPSAVRRTEPFWLDYLSRDHSQLNVATVARAMKLEADWRRMLNEASKRLRLDAVLPSVDIKTEWVRISPVDPAMALYQ